MQVRRNLHLFTLLEVYRDAFISLEGVADEVMSILEDPKLNDFLRTYHDSAVPLNGDFPLEEANSARKRKRRPSAKPRGKINGLVSADAGIVEPEAGAYHTRLYVHNCARTQNS